LAEEETTQEAVDEALPEGLAELLSPVSNESPTGENANAAEEYFKLDMEIGKVTPDYIVCIELAKTILRETSKDLRVASWLTFSWYRTEKILGLLKGVTLMLELMKLFGDKLFPEKPAHRSKALLYLNTGRFVKLLEQEPISSQTAPQILELEKVLKQLEEEAQKQFPASPPELKDLKKVIESHIETVKEEAPPAKSAAADEPAESQEKDAEAPHPPKEAKPAAESKPAAPAAAERAAPAKEVDLGSERDALLAFKKALRFIFQQDDKKAKRQAFLYGIARSVVWDRMSVPPHEDHVTQIAPPDSVVLSMFQQWHADQDGDKLVSNLEVSLLDQDSTVKYWLTGQRMEAQALENAGGGGAKAAEEIKFQLAKLLTRYPNFSKLKFRDKAPFADAETLVWIEDEVKPVIGGGKGGEMILPPIMGEDYVPLTKEYEKACETLPDGFEENLSKIQRGIASEHRRKGHFLRVLNLANFCIKAEEYELARIHLMDLMDKIEAYQLAYWEPALSASAWQSMYIVNQKLMEAETDEEDRGLLERKQRELFSKIGNFDGLLALKLADRNQK
jgi:type VI secretion system protein VasJ